MLEAFLKGLEQPEYVHVLLNPLPVYGLAMGLAALAIALTLRSREARICAFVVIFIASACAWPVSHYGQLGYYRVRAMSDSEGKKWLDGHKRRADQLIYVFYALAAMALLSNAVPARERPKEVLRTVSRAAEGAIAIEGLRAEATTVAPLLLKELDTQSA